MTNFTENSTKVGRSTSDCISPGREKVKIRLALKDKTKRLVLILINFFYFFHSPSNFINLGLLNNVGIYYHNKDHTLYDFKTQKIFAFAKQYKTSFFLHPLNLLAAAINFLKNNRVYKSEKLNINQT